MLTSFNMPYNRGVCICRQVVAVPFLWNTFAGTPQGNLLFYEEFTGEPRNTEMHIPEVRELPRPKMTVPDARETSELKGGPPVPLLTIKKSVCCMRC